VRSEQDATVPIESEQTDDDFQRELVELFGQEAQEWLLQIHSALNELEHQPDLVRHTQLVDAIVRGITSLGGSAATVNLSDVERATFALLPFIDTLKDRSTATKQDYATVRAQFRIVIASVTAATGLPLDLGISEQPSAQSESGADLLTLLNALQTLQDDSAVSGLSSRSLIPQLMQRLEHEARQGTGKIQATQYHQMLRDLQSADAGYLDSIQQRLPRVTQHLNEIRTEGSTAPESSHRFSECSQNIEQLQEIAKQAHAAPLVTYLTGLQSFFSLLAQHHTVISSRRIDAVEARLCAVLMTLQQWITAGEQERDAMGRLLPMA
jgi:chemotaxis protein histidine kinase CheA